MFWDAVSSIKTKTKDIELSNIGIAKIADDHVLYEKARIYQNHEVLGSINCAFECACTVDKEESRQVELLLTVLKIWKTVVSW